MCRSVTTTGITLQPQKIVVVACDLKKKKKWREFPKDLKNKTTIDCENQKKIIGHFSFQELLRK